MSMERTRGVRTLVTMAALCGCVSAVQAQQNNQNGLTPKMPVAPVAPPRAPAARPAAPAAAPAQRPAITRPQPRLIAEPGKPLIYTTVPQPLGTVPVSITRGPTSIPLNNTPGSSEGWFEQPVRRGGLLGGVPVRFPNVLSPSASSVPETWGPFVARNPRMCPAPWPCPVEPRGHWSNHGGGRSMVSPSGAVLVSSGSSLGAGSYATLNSGGFSANIDTGNVQIHIGSTPPVWGGSGWNGWHGSGWCGNGWGNESGWCHDRPILCSSTCWNPVYRSAWDYGWWTWYDNSYYSGPVYGSGWYQYDPALFYPQSVTQPPAAGTTADKTSQADPNEALIGLANELMGESQYSQAAQALKEYTRREPSDAGAWRWLGIAQLADRQVKDAVYSFGKAYQVNESIADLGLEYEAMGLDRSDLRELCSPLLTYARVSKSADAYLMAAVVMDARGLGDQARKLMTEAKAAGLDVMLAQRVLAGFAK